MRDAFIARLTEVARRDPKVMLITGDLGFGVLTKFADEFPKQFLNAGVAEQNMTLLATGLAMGGRTVFTYSIANFPILRPLEMIRNDACYHGANVKVVGIGGGFSYGSLGISHHATEDLAILRSLPDITVVAPCDLYETQEATSALVSTPGTAYLRLDKSVAKPLADTVEPFVLGRARRWREGTDLTFVTCGGIMQCVLAACENLATDGIQCRILSMHTVKPIDREAILAAARETGGIVTVEEHTLDGGLGSAVAEVCMDAGVIPERFHRIGLRSGFSSIVGSQEYLRKVYGLDAAAIVGEARRILATGRNAVVSVDATG
ncbi:MAG: transketolase [Armatimonadetes bacterium]|nr:transketolase [Armatimonadota bacterium]